MIKISVILPNYNHAKYLPESLGALLNQTSSPDEIIVVDDGSTDNSLEVLYEIQRNHPIIQVIENKKNLGFFETIKKGLSFSSGNYILFTAADDLVFPTLFEESKKAIQKYPQAAFICSKVSIFYDRTPYKFLAPAASIAETPAIFYPEDFINLCKNKSFIVFSNTVIYKKNTLKRNFYIPELKSLMDFYLNCEIALDSPIAYIPRILGSFRKVPNSYGDSIRKNYKDRLKVYDHLIHLILKIKPTSFRKKFFDSELISCCGYFMILFLILRPQYWYLLPKMTFQVLKRKFKKEKLYVAPQEQLIPCEYRSKNKN